MVYDRSSDAETNGDLMVYYNPDDEKPERSFPDISASISVVELYIEKKLQFPDYPVSTEKLREIAQKRQGLMMFIDYLVKHCYEAPVWNLLDNFMCKIMCKKAGMRPGSEIRKYYENIYNVLDDIVEYFF